MNRKTLLVLAGGGVAGTLAIAAAVPRLRRRALRATTILKKDHRVVRGLFFALRQTANVSLRLSIFHQLKRRMEVHAQAEEEIFYPAIRNLYTSAAQNQVDEAVGEHEKIRNLLYEIATTDPDSYQFMSKCNELKELVDHHVAEEEGEMFPMAQSNMSRAELDHLGLRIHDRKVQLKERVAA